jgi:hypothetical protein
MSLEGTMSGLSPRWKEKRMQEEIYKQRFKYVKGSSNGLSPHGSNGTMIALDHQTPGAVGWQPELEGRSCSCSFSGAQRG